jgi:hypothetical protein
VTNDPKIAFEQMRKETGSMLGYKDADAPSLIQNLQIDCVALLRFSIDHLQAEVFAGHDVDLNKLATSLTMLRQLLPERSLQAPPPLDEFRPGEAEEIADQFNRKVDSLIVERQRRLSEDPDAARAALEDEIAEAQKRFPQPPSKPPWGAPPPVEAAPIKQTTKQTTPSEQTAPAPSPPLPPKESDSEWHARINSRKPPAHYLRSQQDEQIARWGSSFLSRCVRITTDQTRGAGN